jgi:acyl-coenzyme A synthetase/AMP-(fatty) acid ligase/3-hydroxymyristoyl/3-hydroxydecanoyl-(acyl carrier protein) dehydratase
LLPEAAADAGERGGVLIACTDRYLFAVALLASWTRKQPAVLPPSHRPAALAELIAGEGVAATVHDGELETGLDLRRVLQTSAPTPGTPPPALAADAHAITLYTSGSTGAPERVVKRADQLLGEVDVLSARFGAEITRVLSTVPPRHIYGLLFGLLLPLRSAAAFVRETPLHTDAIVELVRRHGVDTFVGVPAHLRGVASVAPSDLSGLRRVFSSGAPLATATFDLLSQRLGLRVVEVLGSTETGGIGYRGAAADPYVPFEGVRVEQGPEGQLMLWSPRLAANVAQPLACEDRIELLASGAFRHLGRADDVVKVGATRVSLLEVEQRARALPGVDDAAVIARAISGARGHEILLAAAAPGWDAARMRDALGAWLPAVALPRRYRFVAELPRESTGKLRRDALLALFEPAAAEIEWGERVRDGARVRVELRVPAGLVYFRGHFDDWPVLPGVAQLGLLAVREALATWPDLRALRRVRQLKFKRPIEPDEALALELVRHDDARIDFRIERAGELCSSGSLIFAPRRVP